MDGWVRATDNIYIERLWRSVKQENVYLNAYETGHEFFAGLTVIEPVEIKRILIFTTQNGVINISTSLNNHHLIINAL